MATTEKPSAFIGQALPRKEDPELITGRSRFVNDITVPGMLWAYVVRSPFAHAKINGVNVSKALAMEGCVAAFSGADLAEEWAAPLVCAWPVTDDIKMSEHWPLAKDKARHAGDGVAVVVAGVAGAREGRRRAGGGRLGAAPGGHRPAGGDGGRRPAGPRRLRHQRLERLGLREGRLARPPTRPRSRSSTTPTS